MLSHGAVPPTGDPMPSLVATVRDHPGDEPAIVACVRECLLMGYVLADIGPATGLTVEAAQQRWGHLDGTPT